MKCIFIYIYIYTHTSVYIYTYVLTFLSTILGAGVAIRLVHDLLRETTSRECDHLWAHLAKPNLTPGNRVQLANLGAFLLGVWSFLTRGLRMISF